MAAPASQKGRKSPRLQVSLTARYRSPTAFEFVKEQCFDLSAGGMFIKSPTPAPAGTLIKLECDVDHGAHTIRGVARVVWLRELDAEGQPAGMGIKFVKLEAGGREAIQAVLQQLGPETEDVMQLDARRSDAPIDALAEPFSRTPSASPRRSTPRPPAPIAPEPSSSPTPVAEAAPQAAIDPEDSRETERPPGSPRDAKRSDPRELRQRLQHAKRSEKRVAPGQDAPTPLEMPVPPEVTAAIARAAEQVASNKAAAQPASSPKAQSKPTAQSKPDPIANEPKAKPVAKPAPISSPAPVPTRGVPDAPSPPASTRPMVYGIVTVLAAVALYAAFSDRKPAARRAPRAEPPQTAVAPTAEPPQAPEASPQVEPAPTVSEPPPPAPQAAPTPEPKYVLEVATTPADAQVTAGKQTLVAPGNLDLGALEEPVQLEAKKPGFQTANAIVDRVGFMLEDGAMRRRIVLTLIEEPKPAPVVAQKARARTAEPAPKVARAKPTPSAPVAQTKPAKEQPALVVEPKPEPAPKAEPKPAPPAAVAAPEAKPPKAEPAATETQKPAAKQTPMQAATECLGTGDNACVIKALEGKAKSAPEVELLIETYRAMGNAEQAQKQMQIYVDKYPTERHAAGYRRVLDRHQGEAPKPP